MTAEQLAHLVDADWALGRDGGALPRRLALELRHLITGELLAAGTRLPPERTLAQTFHVSRPTVTAALDELRAVGLLESRQGSGTWVSDRPRTTIRPQAMSEAVLVDRGINLAAAAAGDASHLGALVEPDLLGTVPAHGLSADGLPELRAALAAHHAAHGLPTTADDIVVTNGAHHALALLVGALCGPGDRVVVEEHTYGGLIDLLDVARARPVAVPRERDGADPDALRRALDRTRPRLVYLLPSVHAPTGLATTARRRAELAAVLDDAGALVVVDETLADVGPPVPSLASLCRTAEVIAVGSLSKLAWSGLRVGWVRARGERRAELLRHRARVDLGSSIPSQLAALRITAAGLDGLAAARRGELASKAVHLRDALADALPEWTVPLPDGGLSLWAELPVRDSAPFAAAAERAGVVAMPGSFARADRGPDPHLRLCFDRSPQILEEAVARLARAWSRA